MDEVCKISLEKIDKYLAETPKDKLVSEMEKYDNIEMQGVTAGEYVMILEYIDL